MVSRCYTSLIAVLAILISFSSSFSAEEIKNRSTPKVTLSQEEIKWLEEHPVLRLAPDPDFPPIEWFDKKGNLSGITSDYIALLQERIGIKFKIVKLKDWETILEKSMAKEVDIWSAATKTAQREEYMKFTTPFLYLPAIIIVRSDKSGSLTVKNLAGMRVGVTQGYAAHDYLKQNHPELNLITTQNVATGLRKVSFGGLDAFIANIATASYFIEKEAIGNLRVAGEIGFHYELSFAVRDDWSELLGILEKGLATITLDEKREILRKRIIEPKKPWLTFTELLILILVIGTISGIGFVLFWNRSLKKQVELRTNELYNELAERKKVEENLRAAKEQAEMANRIRSEMLANTSHELRTPLNSIQGFSRHLLRTELSDEQKKPLQIIHDSSEKLLHLINTLLEAGTVEHGTAELDETPFNFIEFMEMTIEFAQKSAESKGLVFSYSISSDVPAILIGDSGKLMQISKNILNNAVKFTAKGELKMTIQLASEQPDKRAWIHFSIVDTGIGIPDDKKSIVFENFKQADGTISRKFEGIGIGASNSKRFVELMGGKIWFESEVGTGTTFHYILPFHVA